MTDAFPAHQVTERIDNAHSEIPDYPLLPGDLVSVRPDGAFTKFAPGLAVSNFRLSHVDRQSLNPVLVRSDGALGYAVEEVG